MKSDVTLNFFKDEMVRLLVEKQKIKKDMQSNLVTHSTGYRKLKKIKEDLEYVELKIVELAK